MLGVDSPSNATIRKVKMDLRIDKFNSALRECFNFSKNFNCLPEMGTDPE